jgi:hypothetical protein
MVGLVFEALKSTSFLFKHFRSTRNLASTSKRLARPLHYSKAKRGRHENQDEREGWHESRPLNRKQHKAASKD